MARHSDEPGSGPVAPNPHRSVGNITYFLAKTDPETYSLDDLERDRSTVWDGVTNAQAVQAIRRMRAGDRMLIYHSGGESAVVGWAQIRSDARDDAANPRSAVIDVEFGGRIDPPVTLKEIKDTALFAAWALVKQGRLSTMEAPAGFIGWLKKQRKAPGL